MHNEEIINEHHKLCVSLARQNDIPYYCLDKYESVPTSVRYPIEDIIEFFQTDYLNSSVDYAIAFAIFNGAKKIALYGMSLSALDEYFFQKASLEAWIWRAIGMGIEVEIGDPEHTVLFHTVRSDGKKVSTRPSNNMYGYLHPQKFKGWPGHEDIEYNFPNHEKVECEVCDNC